MKNLVFISLAFIIGISLSSVQAISPFTEIGNLEMEVLDALNEIVSDLNAEIVRIDSLISIQISEQIEQDTLQSNQIALQAKVAGIQSIIRSELIDTNNSICELTVAPNFAPGWCPSGQVNNFNITDSNIIDDMQINISIKGGLFSICGVPDVVNGSFIMVCGSPPLNGSLLYYSLMQ